MARASFRLILLGSIDFARSLIEVEADSCGACELCSLASGRLLPLLSACVAAVAYEMLLTCIFIPWQRLLLVLMQGLCQINRESLAKRHNKSKHADLQMLSPFLKKASKKPPSFTNRCLRRYVTVKEWVWVVKFIIGLLSGFTVTVWYLVFDFRFDFDHAISLNIVIAAASIIATAIHFDTVKKQRRDRVWEINKDNLINLSKAVASAIKISSELSEREFNKANNIPDDTCTTGSAETHVNLQETISDSLNVYKSLLNKELISAIEKYQETESSIERTYDYDEITLFDALELQCEAQRKLHKVINHFIKEVAGI